MIGPDCTIYFFSNNCLSMIKLLSNAYDGLILYVIGRISQNWKAMLLRKLGNYFLKIDLEMSIHSL